MSRGAESLRRVVFVVVTALAVLISMSVYRWSLGAPASDDHLSIFGLHRKYPNLSSTAVHRRAVYGGLAAGGATWVAGLVGASQALPEHRSTAHGSADFGSVRDAKQADLGVDPSRGVHLGWIGRFQVVSSQHHLLLLAPTGGGKTSRIVFPTAYEYKGSMIITDPKGEAWRYTSGRRAEFSKVFVFDVSVTEDYPDFGRTVSMNPLLMIPHNRQNEIYALRLADSMLVKEQANELWMERSKGLLQALFLAALMRFEEPTLAKIYEKLTDTEMSFESRLSWFLRPGRDIPGSVNGVHPTVVSGIGDILGTGDGKIRDSVMLGVKAALQPFAALYARPHLETLDLTAEDFRQKNGERVTLYLRTPTGMLDEVAPILRSVLYMLLGEMVSGAEGAYYDENGLPLMLLLDELPAFGRMSFLETQLAFVRSYGVRVVAVAQSIKRIRSKYGGREETFSDQLRAVAVFAPASSDTETSELISKMAGDTTVEEERTSHSAGRGGGSTTTSKSVLRRRLLNSDEATRMEDMLVFVPYCPPLRVANIHYKRVRRWRKMSQKPPVICGGGVSGVGRRAAA